MDLKINSVNFVNSKVQQRRSSISMTGKYVGVPNFDNHIKLNPKQSFLTKIAKFFKALYYANFK